MANPTTNYGWPMPTSADLVTDLPADFAAFGQPVDTSLKALNPETTLGDIAYRSATSNTNTRLGIGTAGQVLAVSGGVPAWTTTADVTPLTTKGDLFTFSTVDARLGVGANDQILVANSSTSTGLEWQTPASSGGMTLLASGSFSGSAVNLTSISGSYVNLQLFVRNFKPASDNVGLSFRFNNDSNARYYGYGAVTGGSFSLTSLEMSPGNDNTTAQGLMVYEIPDYANALTWKIINSLPAVNNATTTTQVNYDPRAGVYNQTVAITELNMFPAAGNFTSGTYALYGVK